MIYRSVSVWFSQPNMWLMQITQQTWRLLIALFLILQHLLSGRWHFRTVLVILLWHTVLVKKSFLQQMYWTSCCHSFTFHKWINTVAEHPPCPSKTLASYPDSFCSVIWNMLGLADLILLGFPVTAWEKIRQRLSHSSSATPLSVPRHNCRIKSGGIWKCPHVQGVDIQTAATLRLTPNEGWWWMQAFKAWVMSHEISDIRGRQTESRWCLHQ